MSNQHMLNNILPPGTLWGDLVMTIPQFDMSWWDDVESIQAWGDLAFPVEDDSIPVIDPPEELDDEYENMPGLTIAEEAWSEYIPVAEPLPLEVAPEEDLIVPIPIVETVADVSTSSHREENP